MGRKYNIRKYISVAAITLGIIICTLATQNASAKSDVKRSAEADKDYAIGIVMLTIALLASAILAIFQEKLYSKHGKYPREAMFVVHGLSLPIFLFMWEDISRNATLLSTTNYGTEDLVYLIFPGYLKGWVDLTGAVILQWVCISFVYQLNSVTDSLTVTLVVTLRKFLSLLVSIFWFQNPFTTMHWFGAILVFGGTLAFADIWGSKQVVKDDKKKN
uniref:TPT domain-containing protein n=1 Tax=Rhabditophanes sp. KR3021 TaxID=114890 RepID=A0AC35U5G2_9BILA